jgi:exodeoxyribonuclease V alpha subunit
MPMPNDAEIFNRLDLAFARFLSQRTALDVAKKKELEILLATLSQKQNQGHSCIGINVLDKRLLLDSGLAIEFPSAITQSYPLVIEQNRLYLQRYWCYEDRLAKQIMRLAQQNNSTETPSPAGEESKSSNSTIFVEHLDSLLDRYFGAANAVIDWQREAAKKAVQQAFCIITGGPGTGKTTTICKILAVLQELADKPLLIALAAPTGKAAMRLQEAIALNMADIDYPDNIKASMPRTAITLHRLLGAKPLSPYFKHDATNPLVFDLVVVDEASMVDLALMSKLVDALKPEARLILLGDKDQLASVESGAVELKLSYRFDDGIKKLAYAVNQQDSETAWHLLNSSDEATGILQQVQFMPYILEQREDYAGLVNAEVEFSEIYQSFTRFQVLCSNRYGKNGALEINAMVERELFGKDVLRSPTNWYTGRPVMVMQNNPALHLYNGDVGICLPDKEQNDDLMVFFQRVDGTVKKYLPARMPTCETVFAMTVHKSQGSEFGEVLIVLPEISNPVLSKELLYTAITRAKQKLTIVAQENIFTTTIRTKIERVTGLANKFQSKVISNKDNLSAL